MPRLPGRDSTRGGVVGSLTADPDERWSEDRFRRNLELARATAPKRIPKTCTDCGLHPKQLGHPLWCADCWLRRQPPEVQAAACARRAARIPVEDWVTRRDDAPEGHRWCRSCQSHRLLVDFKGAATQCTACASTAAHRTRLERVYEDIDRFDYEKCLGLQDNRCAICRKQFRQRPNIDHDHVSNATRGLLCDNCNYELLGAAASAGDASSEGAIRILLMAVHYLRNPPMSGRWKPGTEIDAYSEPPF